jgi:hypothetical protein
MRTIAELGSYGALGLSTRVARTFKTREAARRYRNGQPRHVRIRELDGRWKVGQDVPVGTPSRSIDA